MLDVLSQYVNQDFSQTLKTGRREGMFCHKIIRDNLSEFSSYLLQKWVSIGRLDSLLAKTLMGIHPCMLLCIKV